MCRSDKTVSGTRKNEVSMPRQVVLLLGAGASVADVATRPLKRRPPLDRGFFGIARGTARGRVEVISRYMSETYDLDVLHPDQDSLEGVMGLLYPDIFNPFLRGRATPVFRALLQLFTARLAETTNDIPATQKRLLYRIVTRFLADGVAPENLTIITF